MTAAAQLGHDAGRPILVTGATGQQVEILLRYLRAHSIAPTQSSINVLVETGDSK